MPPSLRILATIFACCLPFAAVARAQEAASLPRAAELRVLLECEACPVALIQQMIPYAEWVADSSDATVHSRTRQGPTSDGGVKYVVTFTGRARFSGKADTLTLGVSTAHATERDERLAQLIQLGLMRYAADTELAPSLRVTFAPAPTPAPAPAPEPVRRWAAALDLGFTGSSGNSELISLSSGIRIRHLQTNRFRLEGGATFRYGESEGRVAARQIQTNLNFDMGPDARFAPFVSVAAERDPFRKFDLRSKAGTGVRFGMHKSADAEVSLRAAIQYNHERFTREVNLSPKSDGAWSFEFKGSQRLGSNIRLENTSTYDPTMDDAGDYIFDAKSKMSTRITARLALTLGHAYSYDSTPVTGVRRSDQRFQAGLTLDF